MDNPGFNVLRCAAKYKNMQIEDGLACGWGEYDNLPGCKLNFAICEMQHFRPWRRTSQ